MCKSSYKWSSGYRFTELSQCTGIILFKAQQITLRVTAGTGDAGIHGVDQLHFSRDIIHTFRTFIHYILKTFFGCGIIEVTHTSTAQTQNPVAAFAQSFIETFRLYKRRLKIFLLHKQPKQ